MADADSTSCVHCDAPFEQNTGRGPKKKYCSPKCRHKSNKANAIKPKRIPLSNRTCAGCGASYAPKQRNQRYCKRGCQGCGNAKCINCGADYFTTRNSRGKYCSIACCASAKAKRGARDRLRRIQGEYCRVSIKPCICCDSGLVGPKPTRAWAGKFCQPCKDALGNAIGSNVGRIDLLRAKLMGNAPVGRECEICGAAFIPLHDRTTTCSGECQKKTDRAREARKRYVEAFRKTEAYKRKKRIQNRTRRARKYGNGPVDQIDPIEILERDGWRCHVCGVYTPKKLRGHLTDPRAPVMDHVIPLAAGGTHTFDNVACCCAKCNTEKGHEIYQGDMFVGDGARPHPNGG